MTHVKGVIEEPRMNVSQYRSFAGTIDVYTEMQRDC